MSGKSAIKRCERTAVYGLTRGDETANLCADHLAFIVKDASPEALLIYWLQASRQCDYRQVEPVAI